METNNISTIATFLAICITGILAYFGYTVDQAQLATVLMSVLTLIIAIWSSKNPNTFACLGNAPETIDNDDEELVLNDEYECDEDEC
jgi:type IV secretory pathway VirB2 component (pilin)